MKAASPVTLAAMMVVPTATATLPTIRAATPAAAAAAAMSVSVWTETLTTAEHAETNKAMVTCSWVGVLS